MRLSKVLSILHQSFIRQSKFSTSSLGPIRHSVKLKDGPNISFETELRCPGVVGSAGETTVMATVVTSKPTFVNMLPLLVDYRRLAQSNNKIPSTYNRRESPINDMEILGARAIDRSLRPNFPKDYKKETQVVVTVLSYDGINDPLPLGINTASVALSIAIPEFKGPVAAVALQKYDGEESSSMYVQEKMKEFDILVVSKGPKQIIMIEGCALEIEEAKLVEALIHACKINEVILELQQKFLFDRRERDSIQSVVSKQSSIPYSLVYRDLYDKAYIMLSTPNVTKEERRIAQSEYWANSKALVKAQVGEHVDKLEMDEIIYSALAEAIKDLAFGRKLREWSREGSIKVESRQGRPDGRSLGDIRQISCEVDLLPVVHGSSLFTRGNTQVLACITLSPVDNSVKVFDDLKGGYNMKDFALHYRFPSYAVGGVGQDFTNRRMIGHGNLAEKAITAVMPKVEDISCFVRITCEVTASDGSTSMASVCASSLALMDAGVPIKRPVAGISVGIHVENIEEKKYKLLSDILGMEDHFGEMDFKVAGTELGITALQLDIKTEHLTIDIIQDALEKARIARLRVLELMNSAISTPREEFKIRPVCDSLKLRRNISKETLCDIETATGARLNLSLDKQVLFIFAPSHESIKQVKELVQK